MERINPVMENLGGSGEVYRFGSVYTLVRTKSVSMADGGTDFKIANGKSSNSQDLWRFSRAESTLRVKPSDPKPSRKSGFV
jgi:hypothetical protein